MANAIWLLDDFVTGYLGPITPGTSETVENSQCRIGGAGSGFTVSGNILRLNIPVTFKGTFAGTQNMYLYAYDYAGAETQGWALKGSYTVR